ncbi:MAG: sigma-70 family RNA polymerase sigma factor [Acidobacteria bacterium]|nr:sigma-70 family RNA polymerase sigma factor [Acidobacteriota bacterium]
MLTSSDQNVTQLLLAWSQGDQTALEQLLPLVDAELRRLAHAYMRRESVDHTLQTSALVNEAYLRLIDQQQVRWQNRAHFFGITAQLMRRILLDHARGHARAKRGGHTQIVALEEAATVPTASGQKAAELIALDDALMELEHFDARKSRLVELRFFGGLSNEEVAEVMQISLRTVEREWQKAKAWLHQALTEQKEDRSDADLR